MPRKSVLSAAVGAGGGNQPNDVGLVQILLNVMRGVQRKSLLQVDGIAGPRTIEAIKEFQSQFGRRADGRVDPSGPTLRLLIYAYISVMRLGVCRMSPFPPAFSELAGRDRPHPSAIGDLLAMGLSDLRRGLTPFLKSRAPGQKQQPAPQEPLRHEQQLTSIDIA